MGAVVRTGATEATCETEVGGETFTKGRTTG